MKKKKTLLIVIIILIVLLVLAGGAFAYIYFGTDLLKTDKELFAKYFMQMGDEEKGIFPKNFVDYVDKRELNAYTTNGSFSAVTDMLTDTTSDLETAMMAQLNEYGNNTNITFSGSVDNANRKVEQDISINYNDSVSLPFKYKQVGDVYGIQADFLSSSYISVENNNLPDLLQKLGATDVSTVPYKIEAQEIESLQFTDEELTHIQETYITPMFNNLSEDKFSKLENTDGSVSYTLTLTNIEIRDIIVNMLQTLSTDTTMLNKINSILAEIYGDSSVSIASEDIQEVIDDLANTTMTETSFNISVTQNNRETNAISISSGDVTAQFLILKSDSNVTYTFSVNSADEVNCSMTMTYSGIDTNTVTEAVDVNLYVTDALDTTYSFENTVNFDASINIEDFDDSNMVLNNYPAEQVQPFVGQVISYIVQMNSYQMTQIGFPSELGNPMVMWIAGPGLAMSIYSSAQESVGSTSLSAQEVAANNAIFENYKGEITGASAKTLCQTVENQNLYSTNGMVNVKLGEEASATAFTTSINDIDSIMNRIDSSATYNVTISYDATTGYVCEIGITPIQ